MSDPKVVKKKLLFNGDSGIRPKRKEKRKIDEVDPINQNEEDEEIKILQGTGRFTSSSTTIHGNFTLFMEELEPGDAIIITHPTTLVDETKIIRMVLSNVSMSISSAFSTDLISTTSFRFIKAPKDKIQEEKNRKEMAVEKQRKTEQEAFGTYASIGGENFTYRVKKEGAFGGYKIVTEKLNEKTTRESLLDMRAKKKSDRFCY